MEVLKEKKEPQANLGNLDCLDGKEIKDHQECRVILVVQVSME